jgi:hypothetical protein
MMELLEKRVGILELEIAALKLQLASMARAPAHAPATVDAGNLDDERGNFEVRKDPPLWIRDGGESFLGHRLSECPTDYLEKLAGFLDWQAKKDEESNYVSPSGRPTAPYKRKDAARARGWAARLRTGQGPQPAKRDDVDLDDDELPF